MPTTPRGVWTPDNSDDFDLITDLAAMGVSIDTAIGVVAGTVIYRSGPTSSRPAAGSVAAGYLWYATDTKVLWRNSGTAWEQFGFGTFKTVFASANAVGNINSGTWSVPTGVSLSTTVTTPIACRAKITLTAQGNGQTPGTGWSAGVALTGATTSSPAINTPASIRYISSMSNSAAAAAIPVFTMSNSWIVNLAPGTTTFTLQGIAEGPGGVRTIGYPSLIIEPVSE